VEGAQVSLWHHFPRYPSGDSASWWLDHAVSEWLMSDEWINDCGVLARVALRPGGRSKTRMSFGTGCRIPTGFATSNAATAVFAGAAAFS